ncbi:rRNA maturation RNase YbeY [Dehalobacterium formicoaceticum]|uniref:Endoribonuclease YbeY n=1 Tax=Dehalobacterium formicoaceticum TaxID=51515 RepID=A0ABT1Y242_9FIRM|nr:rRNA maturation RNase YbeY [Dehalobacterium formicoaceticum]MCR6544029.1 rRNA maturation RNase YbeY [Dehalobacterium formicoaceticum]
MELIIRNQQDKINLPPEMEKLLSDVVAEVLKAEAEHMEWEVSILLVDDREISSLNRNYRGIDRPTDVLSFAMEEDLAGVDLPEFIVPEDNPILGDIVISVETAQRQGEEYGHSLEREMGFLTVHGMLHLLGYDHETEDERTEMRGKEEKVLLKLGLFREE